MSAHPSGEREIGHLLATSEDHERRIEALEKKMERVWQVYIFIMSAAGIISYLIGVMNSDWVQGVAKRVVGG